MDEMMLREHNLEIYKNELKNFARQTLKDISLEKVPEDGGLFWLGNHMVTGIELNKFNGQIQSHLRDIYSLTKKTIEEFEQIYNVVEVLDKDYICSIRDNLKAVEKNHDGLNETVKILEETVNKLLETDEKADKNRREIKSQEIHGKSVEERTDYAIDEIDTIKTLFAEKERAHKEQISVLANKLKLSYVAVGGSVAIVVAQLILNILGII